MSLIDTLEKYPRLKEAYIKRLSSVEFVGDVSKVINDCLDKARKIPDKDSMNTASDKIKRKER